jgi:hypothetical protein
MHSSDPRVTPLRMNCPGSADGADCKPMASSPYRHTPRICPNGSFTPSSGTLSQAPNDSMASDVPLSSSANNRGPIAIDVSHDNGSSLYPDVVIRFDQARSHRRRFVGVGLTQIAKIEFC